MYLDLRVAIGRLRQRIGGGRVGMWDGLRRKILRRWRRGLLRDGLRWFRHIRTVRDGLSSGRLVQDTKRDAVLLVTKHRLLPVLHPRQFSPIHEGFDILDGKVCCGIANLHERHRYQAWPPEFADGFRHKPFPVRLRDD
jgi:hypothetical protein